MTAIYGIVGGGDLGILHAMGTRLEHRGAKHHEFSPSPNVYFGIRREGSERLTQNTLPLVSDATLYNIPDLANHLGLKPDGSADELLHRGIHEEGPGFVSRICGDLALAYHDAGESRLVLARDQFGARMLYFWEGHGVVAFASEYKALLAFEEIIPEPDLAALQILQCSKYLPDGRTLLGNISAVPGGSYMIFDAGGRKNRRYFEVQPSKSNIGLDEAAHRLRDLFLAAVGKRVLPDERVGVELSGGIDSAAVLAAVRSTHPDLTPRTFTVGYGASDPEIQAARRMAEIFSTTHTEVLIGPDEIALTLPSLIWHLEDPIARTDPLLNYKLTAAARDDVDVLLGGYASDGLFAGVPKHKLVRLMQLLPPARGALQDLYTYSQSSGTPRTLSGRLLKRVYYGPGEMPALRVLNAPHGCAGKPPSGPARGLLNRSLLDGLHLSLPSWYAKVEKVHVAHGVEIRTPFNDEDLARFAFSLPEKFKIRRLKEKYILRRALVPLLPRESIRQPKFPQAMDYGPALSDALDELCDRYLSADSVKSRGFFDLQEISALRRRAPGKAYGANRAMRLWTAIGTEIWARLFLDHRGRELSDGRC